MKNKTSKALAALTQAALALPGIAAAEVQTDYLFSQYNEQDIPRERLAAGSAQRYDIESHLFRAVAGLGEQTVGLNFTYENMSGASPWYVQPGPQGQPLQVMSGASIREERIDAQGTWSLPVGAGLQTALSAGYSDENDYRAINGGAELELTDNDRGLTLTGGLGFSSDTIEPVQKTGFNRIREDDKTTFTAYGGGALVLDAATVAQLSLNYQRGDGYLSDPYKLAWIVDRTDTVNDSRPDGRQSWALSAKLRHHFAGANAALHLDYRYYHDDWQIDAHTVDLAWHQVLPGNWRLSPALRWYSQSQAYFYAPYYATQRADGFASSDYRLSPYGALSGRLDLTKAIGGFTLGGGVEYYQADADYALEKVDVENPGLVEYLSYQARLSYRF